MASLYENRRDDPSLQTNPYHLTDDEQITMEEYVGGTLFDLGLLTLDDDTGEFTSLGEEQCMDLGRQFVRHVLARLSELDLLYDDREGEGIEDQMECALCNGPLHTAEDWFVDNRGTAHAVHSACADEVRQGEVPVPDTLDRLFAPLIAPEENPRYARPNDEWGMLDG